MSEGKEQYHSYVLRVPIEDEDFLQKLNKYLNKESYSVRRKFTGSRPKGTPQQSTLKENAHSIRIYITETDGFKANNPLTVAINKGKVDRIRKLTDGFQENIMKAVGVEQRQTRRIVITPPPEHIPMILEDGHNCEDYVKHGLYQRPNGSTNDYYYCTKCDKLLQTG